MLRPEATRLPRIGLDLQLEMEGAMSCGKESWLRGTGAFSSCLPPIIHSISVVSLGCTLNNCMHQSTISRFVDD